ncbi:MAG: glycosyltransferase WbuB [Actinobacteria bacterium HGW-Actinobacteria-7]|nr:MAG: glycosyltransferase WbuB [Actinobacteria bacterium HGW-Actinobacteria-7]
MTRKVLIVNETPVPPDERCWLEAKTLARAGYQVSVVCTKMDAEVDAHRVLEGVDIYAYNPPRQAHGLWSFAWELAYCWAHSTRLSIRLAREVGFDVVHACNPPDTFFALAALFRPFGKKFVFAQHDLVPELWLSRFGDRGMIGRVLHRGLLLMERLSYLIAEVVIVPNESYKRVAMRRGRLPAESVFVVRNGPDLEKIFLADPDESLREGREHLVCYLGVMNPQDGVDYLIRAVAALVHKHGRRDTQFALIGSGDVIDELKALAAELDVEEYVTFTGWVFEPNLLSRYLRSADVCVAPDPKTPLNEVSSFMKIMDYMAVARPIVAFDLAETRVSAGDAALYAAPDDVDDFAAKISELLDDPQEREELGQIGRRRIEESLSWTHQEAALLAAYEVVFRDHVESIEPEGQPE